jgi:hypothetical protein
MSKSGREAHSHPYYPYYPGWGYLFVYIPMIVLVWLGCKLLTIQTMHGCNRS